MAECAASAELGEYAAFMFVLNEAPANLNRARKLKQVVLDHTVVVLYLSNDTPVYIEIIK